MVTLRRLILRGTWLAQSVEHVTLDLGVVSLSPASGSVLAAWSPLGILSLSLSLCPSPTCAVSVSLKINKQT